MRIVLVGAGSMVFTRRLLADLFSYSDLRDQTVVLHDINADRLETATRMAHKLAGVAAAHPVIESTLDRRDALDGADYVINTIEIGGARATRLDFDIPARFGLAYAINDTIGIGGVMRGLRTIGPVLDIVSDMEEFCPDAWLLNHTNPMAMVVRAISARSEVRTIGLCHAVSNTIETISQYLAIPPDEIDYVSGGINHLAFMLRLEHEGSDIYPRLRAFAASARLPDDDLVRLELLRRLGYYPTESSEHHADYSPWFSPKSGAIERFNVPIGEYLTRVDDGLAEYEKTVRSLDRAEVWTIERSAEYTTAIMSSMTRGEPVRIVGNVMNSAGFVPDFPVDVCIEVPCTVDAAGIRPDHVGPLPPQIAAYMRSAVDTQVLTVQAVLEEDRDAIYHAVMQDPIVAASLDLEQVWQVTDALIDAEQEWLPGWLSGTARA
ncbi:MAG: alpha-galactosidase [Chloroflexota bacterium]